MTVLPFDGIAPMQLKLPLDPALPRVKRLEAQGSRCFGQARARICGYRLLLIAFVCSAALAARAGKQNPQDLKAQGYVNDYAQVLSEKARDELTALCGQVEQKAQAQIAVVTVKSTGGRPIEEYSIDLASHLGVGPKKTDRGVMILLATADHKYRIEVGYGLEGILPDGKVGGIGREAVPYLRRNDYDGALLLTTRRVADVIAADRGVSLTNEPAVAAANPNVQPEEGWGVGAAVLLFGFFFFIFWVIRRVFRGPRGGHFGGGGWWIWPMMGGWGRGGFGGGGWGGGGWSGGSGWGGGGGSSGGGFGGFGGGSFGGGGASGSW